jgi:rhodanese-related sulfurtransferase
MPGVPSISVDQLADPLPAGTTVLDVRQPIEWQQGHIEGAIHIPMPEVPEHLDEIPTDRDVLVVCAVGARSARVVQYLQHQGIDACNLDGGLVEWQAAGRPLVSDAGGPTIA